MRNIFYLNSYIRSIIFILILAFSTCSFAAWEKVAGTTSDLKEPYGPLTVYQNYKFGGGAMCSPISMHRIVNILKPGVCPTLESFMQRLYGMGSPDVNWLRNNIVTRFALGYLGIASNLISPTYNEELLASAFDKFGALSIHFTIPPQEGSLGGAHMVAVNRIFENNTPVYLLADSSRGVYRMDSHSEISSVLNTLYIRKPSNILKRFFNNKNEKTIAFSKFTGYQIVPAIPLPRVPNSIEDSFMYAMYSISETPEYQSFMEGDGLADTMQNFYASLATTDSTAAVLAGSGMLKVAFDLGLRSSSQAVHTYANLLANPGEALFHVGVFAWVRLRLEMQRKR